MLKKASMDKILANEEIRSLFLQRWVPVLGKDFDVF